jgi:hypothetical protein
MTALQAALSGVAGGAQGYAQYQRQQREEEARKAEMERQRVRDALAQSQFDLQTKEFEERFGPAAKAIADAQRKADEERENARLALEGRRVANAEAELELKRKAGGSAAPRQLSPGDAQKAQQRLSSAEAWWNATLAAQANSPEEKAAAVRMTETFDRLRRGNPRQDPRELMAGMYEAEQQRQSGRVRAAGNRPVPADSSFRPVPRSQPAGASMYTDAQRADRWEELVNSGMSEEEASRKVRQEMP